MFEKIWLSGLLVGLLQFTGIAMAGDGSELIVAIYSGDIDKAKALLASNPSWVNFRDPDGQTSLHLAVEILRSRDVV
ncbi:MAG: ankyrin repeat domain-containing protein, partial [Nitrospira sp.]|nr:ankyrin repeat domain-containing protein [Nitrospira sp.]